LIKDNDSEPKILVPILKNPSEEVEPRDNPRKKSLHFNELVRFARIPALDKYGDPVFEPESKLFGMSYRQLRHGPSPYAGEPEQRTNVLKILGHCDLRANVPEVEAEVEVNKEDSEKECDSRHRFWSKIRNLIHDRTSWENYLNLDLTASSPINPREPPNYFPPMVPSEIVDPGVDSPELSEPLVLPVLVARDEISDNDPEHAEPEDNRTMDDVGRTERPRRSMSMDRLRELYAFDDES